MYRMYCISFVHDCMEAGGCDTGVKAEEHIKVIAENT